MTNMLSPVRRAVVIGFRVFGSMLFIPVTYIVDDKPMQQVLEECRDKIWDEEKIKYRRNHEY